MITTKKISLLFLLAGMIVLFQVTWPILGFNLWQKFVLNGAALISPQPPARGVLGVSIENQHNFPAIVSSLNRETKATYANFSLSVPSIKANLLVTVDSNDLKLGAVHLPGSALPGERGNIFISGHSALPVFFVSLDSAPFVNLTKVKKGDTIEVVAAGAKFTYQVFEIKVTSSSDLSVINPPDSLGRYISLMTCVPPGLNTKRLVVVGKLI